jgi:1-phosphatidylinositol-3-phosphate 5-kinase
LIRYVPFSSYEYVDCYVGPSHRTFILLILEIKLSVYAFHQAFCCQSCKEPTESHVRCYTHQHGSLTISVRRLQKLPGECDGRIWMWHRCLKCEPKDGVPPATRRIVMSDAAWGLSFGKFLELSFSNHSSANRVASCGHSLQRDCLRFYGYAPSMSFACSYCSLLQ